LKRFILFVAASLVFIPRGRCQDLVAAAGKFINLLDSTQKAHALYPFDVDDRYNFYYFPVSNRKGIAMDELNDLQKEAAIDLLKTSVSDETVKKVNDIMAMEIVLKALRTGNPMIISVTGQVLSHHFWYSFRQTIWGWRFDGHHVSAFQPKKKN
jgi:hypothetical protein